MFAANPSLTPAVVTNLLASTTPPTADRCRRSRLRLWPCRCLRCRDRCRYLHAATGCDRSDGLDRVANSRFDGVRNGGRECFRVRQRGRRQRGSLRRRRALRERQFVTLFVCLDTTASGNGGHTLEAVAADAAGNSTASAAISASVSNVPPDTTPPSVSISAPSAGSTVAGTKTVTASATDNVGVAKVDFYVDDVLTATDTSSPYSFAWTPPS